MGKHLTDPQTKWMVSRGPKKLVNLARDGRKNDPNYSKVKYTIKTFEKYLKDLK